MTLKDLQERIWDGWGCYCEYDCPCKKLVYNAIEEAYKAGVNNRIDKNH